MYSMQEKPEHIPLTWQNIVLHYGTDKQCEIISWIMGYYSPVQIGREYKYRNTLRNDMSPGCWYEISRNGLVVLVDYADSEYMWKNMFELLMMKSIKESYTIKSFSEALKVINEKFDLKLGAGSETFIDYIPKPVVSNPSEYYRSHKPNGTDIRIVAYQNFSPKAIDYWAQYGIDVNDLEGENLYHVKECYIQAPDAPINGYYSFPCDELTFAIEQDGYLKIYKPLTTYKDQKWRTNMPKDLIFGINTVKKDIQFITKSWKDMMVIRSLGFEAVAVQSEGAVPDKEILENIRANSFMYGPIILFDYDEAGIKAAERLSEITSFDYKFLTGGKDAAEVVKNKGEEFLEEQLHDMQRNLLF